MLATVLLFSEHAMIGAGQETDRALLELGKPIERGFAGGETHYYSLTLASGHYLRVVTEQRGVDIVTALIGPDGQKLIEVDTRDGLHATGSLSVIVAQDGIHQLALRAVDVERVSAVRRYEIRLEELHAATRDDRTRVAAERAHMEGRQLFRRWTAQSISLSIEKYTAALALWRDLADRAGEAATLFGLGWAQDAVGEKQKALDSYMQALGIRRALGDKRGEAETLNHLGAVYQALIDYRRALECYTQALILQQAVGDRRGEAQSLTNLGSIHQSSSDYKKALDYYVQALPLRRVAGDRSGEAETLTLMGGAYRLLGDLKEALDLHDRALALRRGITDPRGEAQTRMGLGIIHDALGEKQKALDYFNHALDLRRSTGDPRGVAQTLNSIGGVYSGLGEPQKALNYYSEALPLTQAVGDRVREGVTLMGLGAIHAGLGDRRKALEYFERALEIRRAAGDRVGQAAALNNIGAVHDGLGEPQKALGYHNQALVLTRAVGDRRGEAQTLFNIGNIYRVLGELQKAYEIFTEALPVARDVGDRFREAAVLSGLARAERDRGNLNEARARSEAALTIIESLRTNVLSQDLRASYFASLRKDFELHIDLAMQLHQRDPFGEHDAAALQTSERARARSLLELLSEAHTDIRHGIDPGLLERERALHQRLNAKAERRAQLVGAKLGDAQTAAVRKELEALTTELQNVEAEIRARSPRYAALTKPQTLGLREIQQMLDADTLLLEYALGDERSYLWAVNESTLTSYELPNRAAIETAARRVYGLLTAREPRPGDTIDLRRARVATADSEYWLEAAALSQMLLGPVAAKLGTKRLIVIADGILQYLPVGALPEPSIPSIGSALRANTNAAQVAAPLIVEHEIVSLPSASVLALLRRERGGRGSAAKAIAVFADPVFDSEDQRVKPKTEASRLKKTTSSTSGSLEQAARDVGITDGRPTRLPFSRQEAEAILAVAPAGNTLMAIGFQASRHAATSADLGEYRIVHFATHGFLNSEHPELSGLVLSLVDEQGTPQDGFLRLHDLYSLNLPAELVVLSACQTALGKEIKGEGLMGLTRGFMYAGAARVVASLWRVDDAATARLMQRFYQGMLGDQRVSPAAALRAAQVAMWRERRFQAPYNWAAFVLQGEWKGWD